MSRLTPLDKALVLILVPLWAVCFALGVKAALHNNGFPSAFVSAPADARGHPTVTLTGLSTSVDEKESGPVRVGDRLLQVGDVDLLGVGPFGFFTSFVEQAGSNPHVAVVLERTGQRREASLRAVAYATWVWPLAPASLVSALTAVFLLLRARPSPMVRAFSQCLLCQAFVCAAEFGGSPAETHASIAVNLVANTLLGPLALRALLLFPQEAPPASVWSRFGPWALLASAPLTASARYGALLSPHVGMPSFGLYWAGTLTICLLVATRNYLRADPIGRRQAKWVLFGLYCAFAPVVASVALVTFEPRFASLVVLAASAVVLVPISLLVSVVRFNLFDIDRLLSATATYNILAVVLVGVGLVVVPRAAESASGLLGIDPRTGQVALSLLLAAVVVPAHRLLRPQIERLFFKERYALDRGIAELLPTLSQCQDARELTERVGAGLRRLLRPEACVVYALGEASYAPVFVEGRAVPPAFGATSPLVGTLAERRSPLALGAAGRRPDEAPLGPFDRAALETLGAEVVVPVRQDAALVAFLCLGPKHSGDVYTSTDISHLASIADKVSTELRRFDQEQTVRKAREMQESLRRYVPGAIVEQISSGAELASGEREVSVMFVDIRGYTSFSESRRAEEIFSTVNRYTETVSRIVRKHGGSVVEFNGDGMMTVFGAPRELAHKERAAVEAAREIVEAVGAPTVEAKLSIGVGIATGEAFVGNIQAVDRMIWSAIGNTTNLAARLQSLTRDLGAALVIDRATWERAQPAVADFEKRRDVPIRGRRDTQEVYALAMPARS